MRFLNDIKNQPQETREIIFYLSVFITVFLVGMVWFNSFRKNLYVLINPEEDFETSLVSDSVSIPSMFGYILQTAGEIKDTALGLVGKDGAVGDHYQIIRKNEDGGVYTLPLSEYK